jgi:hypothetical protein
MNMLDTVEMRGRLRLHLVRADGSEQVVETDNLVVTAGKGIIADRMKAAPAMAAISHASVGTSATAPAAGDVALGAEVAGSRTALQATNVVGAAINYAAILGPGVGTGALVEAGLFNAVSGPTMLARATFAVINKAAGDTLNIAWAVTVG